MDYPFLCVGLEAEGVMASPVLERHFHWKVQRFPGQLGWKHMKHFYSTTFPCSKADLPDFQTNELQGF